MENKIIEKLLDSISNNERVALVTLTDVNGSTPTDEGSIMLVWESGKTFGTIGGGKLEYQVIKDSIEALKNGKNQKFSYSLMPEGNLKMRCGGMADGFIKVFVPKNKILMIGGGHIGENIVHLSKFLNFYITIVDDREDYVNKPSLQEAGKIIISDYSNFIEKVDIDSNTFVVIATKDHAGDQIALEQTIKTEAKYIGVIGSNNKTNFLKGELLKKGYNENEFEKVYAPVGINISNQEPKEIAFSIISEILLIKNSKKLKHMDILKNK